MREDFSPGDFLKDIKDIVDELSMHQTILAKQIIALQNKKLSLEADLESSISDKKTTKAAKITAELKKNGEEIAFYVQSQTDIERQARIIKAIRVNFYHDSLINPKLAATNALEKLIEFESILTDYINSASNKEVSREIIGSAVVLLERSKKTRSQYEKHGVEYTHIKVGAERGQSVEPVLHLKKADIKFMSFSGGGAKGTAYGGALEALDESGILPGIEAVAGSSAGSMMAAFTAAGVSVSNTLSLLQGLTKEVIDKSLGKYVEMGIKRSIMQYVYAELRKPDGHLTIDIEELLRKNPNRSRESLEFLKEIYVFLDDPDHFVTFGMIAKLHEIDPIRFKHLHITASNVDKNQLEIFSSETLDKDANVSVSQACMASSALPVVRAAETIKGQKYRDGGVLDNNPRDCFKHRKGRALAFYFPSESHEQALKGHEEYPGEGEFTWKLEKLMTKSAVTGFKRSGDLHVLAVEKEFYDILNNPFETIIIDTGSVGTVDFKKGTKLMGYLLIKGEIQTQRYLNNFVSDAMHDHTLDFRSVMLKAFEINMKQTELPLTFKSHDEILPLLDFCKKNKWEQAFAANVSGDTKDVVSAVMKDCFQGFKIDKQHKLAKVLAEALNDTECPPKVKEAFIRGLDLTHTQDMSKLSNEPVSPSSKVAKHEVSAEDFKSFISKLNRESARSR